MTATNPAASPAAPDRSTLAAFLGVVLFGGVNAIAVKVSVEELAPFWSAGLRFVAAGLLLVGIVVLTRRSFPRGRSLSGAALYGTLAFAASFGFIYPALREVPAGTAMVLISLVPLLTFAFAILHGQDLSTSRVGMVIPRAQPARPAPVGPASARREGSAASGCPPGRSYLRSRPIGSPPAPLPPEPQSTSGAAGAGW